MCFGLEGRNSNKFLKEFPSLAMRSESNNVDVLLCAPFLGELFVRLVENRKFILSPCRKFCTCIEYVTANNNVNDTIRHLNNLEHLTHSVFIWKDMVFIRVPIVTHIRFDYSDTTKIAQTCEWCQLVCIYFNSIWMFQKTKQNKLILLWFPSIWFVIFNVF